MSRISKERRSKNLELGVVEKEGCEEAGSLALLSEQRRREGRHCEQFLHALSAEEQEDEDEDDEENRE